MNFDKNVDTQAILKWMMALAVAIPRVREAGLLQTAEVLRSLKNALGAVLDEQEVTP